MYSSKSLFFLCRLTAAKCICAISAQTWRELDDNGWPMFLVKYSNIMLILLSDDNFFVRQYVSNHILATLNDHSESSPVIASRAEELFLNLLYIQFIEINYEMAWEYWRYLIQLHQKDTLPTLLSTTCDNSIEVFNKNEANLYGETLQVCRNAYTKMKMSFENRKWDNQEQRLLHETNFKLEFKNLHYLYFSV